MAETTVDSTKLADAKIMSYRFKNFMRTAIVFSLGAGAMFWYLKVYTGKKLI
jgi:hypothetical protein